MWEGFVGDVIDYGVDDVVVGDDEDGFGMW